MIKSSHDNKKLLLAVFVIICLVFIVKTKLSRNVDLTIKFYDVGQGDGVLIKTPSQKHIVIDGGPSYNFIHKLILDLPVGLCHIEALFVTHADLDHYEGIKDVISFCHIKFLYLPKYASQTLSYKELLNYVKFNKSLNKIENILYPETGHTVILDGVELTVLWPLYNSYYLKASNSSNSYSTIIYLKYENMDVLLTGDAEAEIYDHINKNIAPADNVFELLKVPHHGSIDSLNNSFFTVLKPLNSIISAGKNNKYNHPSLDVLNFYKSINSHIYRTDIHNDITFISNGFDYYITYD